MSLYIPCVRLYCNIIATVVPYDRYPDAVVKLVPFSYMDVPSVFPCTKVFPFAEAVIGKMEYSAVGTLCRDHLLFSFRRYKNETSIRAVALIESLALSLDTDAHRIG